MDTNNLISNKYAGNLEILIEKYKRQWRGIKNNTTVIDKTSKIKLHWARQNFSFGQQAPIEIDSKDQNNLRYFLAFTRNLRNKTSFNDTKSFENIITLITYFLLINPQLLAHDITLVDDQKSIISTNTIFQFPGTHDSIWYLIQVTIETFKSQFYSLDISSMNYENYFKLLDTLSFNWLQIGIDIYGISLEKLLNDQVQTAIINTYVKLMDYINVSISEETDDSLEEHICSIDSFIDILLEEAIYLNLLINNNNETDDNIIKQHFRIILYLFDGLIDYLSIYEEDLSDRAIEDPNYLLNIDRLWFLLGYFVKLIYRYVFHKESAHFEIDSLIFALEFINNNLDLINNVVLSNVHKTLNDGFQSTLAESLNLFFKAINHLNCEIVFVFKDYLDLKKFRRLSNGKLTQFNDNLVAVLNKIYNSDNKEISSYDVKMHFIEQFLKLYPSSELLQNSSFFDDRKTIFDFFYSKLQKAAIGATDLVMILKISSTINCQFTNGGICLRCDISEHYYQYQFKKIINKKQQSRKTISDSLNIIYLVLKMHTEKVAKDEVLQEALLSAILKYMNHCNQYDMLTNISELDILADSIDDEKIMNNIKLWNVIKLGFESRLMHLKNLSSDILTLLISSDSSSNNKVTKFVLHYLESSHNSFSVTTIMDTLAKITLTTDSSTSLKNLLLLKHLDFIQEASSVIKSDLAWCNITHISKIIDEFDTTYQLLLPVLPAVVNADALKLDKNPMAIKKLAILTGRPFNKFLSRFINYIIPSDIITYYQTDLIQKLADYIGCTKKDILADSHLLSKIISHIIIQGNCFNAKKIMRVIKNISPDFNSALGKTMNYYESVSEIFQYYSNPVDLVDIKEEMNNDLAFSNQLNIVKSFYYCSLIEYEQDLNSKNKKFDEIDNQFEKIAALTSFDSWPLLQQKAFFRYFENAFIGIIHSFITILCETSVTDIIFDKIRAIDGITIIIIISKKENLISCLPQIVMGLRTGLELIETRHKSLKAWFFLTVKLGVSELVSIIDIPIAFIQREWKYLSVITQELFFKFIGFVLKHDREMTQWSTLNLIKDSSIDFVDRFSKRFVNYKTKNDWFNQLVIVNNQFQQDVVKNDKYVIMRNLLILENILINGTKQMQLKQFSKNIILQELLVNLLEIASRFQNWDFNINVKATECIGYITVVDSTLFNFQLRIKKKTNVDQVYDLYEFPNQCLFMKRLIKYVLIPMFWQVKNPTYQSYISYVMQEFLRECGWSVVYETSSNKNAEQIKIDLRQNFSDLERRIIEPMRSSEFIIRSNYANYEPKQYPIYKKTMSYKKWLNTLTSDLIRRLNQKTQDAGTFIFLKYLQLGKCYEEVVFFETILPYVVVQAILYGGELLIEDWQTEFDLVFKISLSTLNKHQIENIKSIYENIFNVVDYMKKMTSEISAKAVKNDRELVLLDKLARYINKVSFGGVLANKSLEIASYERSILYLEQAFREDDHKQSATYKHKLITAFSNIQDFDALEGVNHFFISGNNIDEKLDNLSNSTNNWLLAKDCYKELQSDWSAATSNLEFKALEILQKNQMFDEIVSKVDTMGIDLNQKCLTFGLESTAIIDDVNKASKLIFETEKNYKFLNPELLLNYSLNKILYASNDFLSSDDYVKLGMTIISQRYISDIKTMTVLKVKDIINKLYVLGDSTICIDFKNIYKNSKKEALRGRIGYEGLDFGSMFKIEAISINLAKQFGDLTKDDLCDRYFNLAQEARKNHRPDIGMKYLMKSFALKYKEETEKFELEYAETLWEAGEKETAVNTIRECSMEIMNSSLKSCTQSKLETLTKYTQWCDYLNRKSPTEIIDQYLKLLQLSNNKESLFFELGLYYDRYCQQRHKTMVKTTVEDVRFDFELIINSIKYLLTALKETTNEHLVKEGLPKVVILWLDTIEKINGKSKYLYVAKEIHVLIQNAIKECKSSIWYTVMLQLISRLLVPSHEARSLITKILSELFKTYPAYIIWHITVMVSSKNEFIKDAGKKILKGFLIKAPKQKKILVTQAELLNDNLSKICNEESKKLPTTIDEDFNFTKRDEIFPSRIAVPVQLNFGVRLPEPELVENFLVTIQDIAETYTVFNSLKKPKKITMLGSNGKQYAILCKKEDVRQDDQYMQFAQTMKYVLNNNADSSKRNMDITTYYIMPLDESFGIIELVPNVVTIRSILSTLYDNRNLYNDRISYMRHWNKFKGNDGQLKLLFEKNIKLFKPILFEWFLSTFPDPTKWYHCRTNFSRSYGVMCMVGHILGLGDRHFDNILISEKNGVVLHVDYDCLFEKGVDLPTPELVPFRLTNNIKDCLGITGVEGTFRKSCELSMKLIRDNEVMLLNEFEMMMYGRMKSLEEYKKTKEGLRESRYLFIGRSGLSPEQILAVIRNKMRGIDPKDAVTVSVAAQVESLLKESQDPNLLYKMYSGWMPIW
ncbi:hypothetical protein QEN19_003665 [Hanseniaspora menglaensis]